MYNKITYKDNEADKVIYIYKNNITIAIQNYNGNVDFEKCFLTAEELQKVIEILQNKR